MKPGAPVQACKCVTPTQPVIHNTGCAPPPSVYSRLCWHLHMSPILLSLLFLSHVFHLSFLCYSWTFPVFMTPFWLLGACLISACWLILYDSCTLVLCIYDSKELKLLAQCMSGFLAPLVKSEEVTQQLWHSWLTCGQLAQPLLIEQVSQADRELYMVCTCMSWNCAV
jgi:hypothetical protein